MKRQLWLFIFFLLGFSLVSPVSAKLPSAVDSLKNSVQQIQIQPCVLTGTCPTAVPTKTPTAVPPTATPEPTAAPTAVPPTPTVEAASSASAAGEEVLGVTAEPSVSVTPRPSPTVMLAATTPGKQGGITGREMGLAGGVLLLLVFIILQNRTKIKNLLQGKKE